MLTPPNEALAARDPALPGLGLLLDADALASALGVARVDLQHLRYKPGTSCSAVVVTDEGPWLRLRGLTSARYAEKSASGPAQLNAVCIEIGSPANDRLVPGLRRLWPEERRGKALTRLFGEGRLSTARLVPLSYRLGRRLVARLEHPDGDALLKVHNPGRFAQALAGALAAEVSGHGKLERACGERSAVATRWMPGATLSAARDTSGFSDAGAALACLHDSRLLLPFPRSRTDEITALQRVLDDARMLLPELAERLDTLSRRLAAALAGAPADPGPIHGDFSADQVVMGAAGVRLIDWDRAGTGDRAGDLGSALARLDAERVLDGLAPEASQAAAAALIEGYAAYRAPPAAVEVQRLAHLARLATEPFRRQLANWPDAILALLHEVEQGLAVLRPSAHADPALPQLATIISAAGAQALLDAAGAGRLAAPPRLLRHKPGRRALVEIVAQGSAGPRAWLAKTRAKRPDHATPALHHALRAAGFDGRTGAPFAVPEMRSGSEGLRTCLIERVEGLMLTDFLVPGADPAPFHAAGRALAALHFADIDPGRAWSIEDEATVALRALDAARERHPLSGPRIAPLQARAAALPQWLPPSSSVLLHRDFYPDQILVDGARIWLIDLDLAARGDAHVDLGNMLAHLTEHALRHHGDATALAEHAHAFLDGYAEGGGNWTENALDEMHAISLMRHLDICDRVTGRAHTFPAILRSLQAGTSDCLTRPSGSEPTVTQRDQAGPDDWTMLRANR